jgi:hypothetical protein
MIKDDCIKVGYDMIKDDCSKFGYNVIKDYCIKVGYNVIKDGYISSDMTWLKIITLSSDITWTYGKGQSTHYTNHRLFERVTYVVASLNFHLAISCTEYQINHPACI